MKILIAIISLGVVGCGIPYNIQYVDPETGVIAGYSSKHGIVVDYRPLSDK